MLEAQKNQCVRVDSCVVQPIRKLVGHRFCAQELPWGSVLQKPSQVSQYSWSFHYILLPSHPVDQTDNRKAPGISNASSYLEAPASVLTTLGVSKSLLKPTKLKYLQCKNKTKIQKDLENRSSTIAGKQSTLHEGTPQAVQLMAWVMAFTQTLTQQARTHLAWCHFHCVGNGPEIKLGWWSCVSASTL